VSAADAARPALFAAERQQRVLTELAQRGRVEAAALAAQLEVSTESIRKDLATLEERGLLTRVHDHTGLVCTNSLPIALTLAERGITGLHILGGAVRRRTLAGVGRTTLDGLAAVNVDVAFLGTNGISLTRGLTTPDEDEALVKNRMLATARRRILLADSAKFGLESLCQHATLSDIDVLITDAGVSQRDVEHLTAQGVEVQIAGGFE